MDFSPRLDKPLLLAWKLARDQLDSINRQDCDAILIVRMEMRSVVRTAGPREHSNHYAEEPRNLGHCGTLSLSTATGTPPSA